MNYIRRTRIAKVSATQFWIAKVSAIRFWIAKVSAIRAYAELPEFRQFKFELPKFQQFRFELPKFQQFNFELPKFWQFDVVYRVTSNWISDTSIRHLATVAKPGDPKILKSCKLWQVVNSISLALGAFMKESAIIIGVNAKSQPYFRTKSRNGSLWMNKNVIN